MRDVPEMRHRIAGASMTRRLSGAASLVLVGEGKVLFVFLCLEMRC